jgi:hypothetical protein
MLSLVLMTALVPGANDTGPGGQPPEQMLASIDAKGKLTLTHAACMCFGPGAHENIVNAHEMKDKEKVAVKVKVKTASVVLTTAELPAKYVEAYTIDGKAIAADKLATLLAKEKTVLVAMDGKKVDPFYLELYKEGTIVLVPPANTINVGGYGAVGAYGVPIEPQVGPGPVEPSLEAKPKEPEASRPSSRR